MTVYFLIILSGLDEVKHKILRNRLKQYAGPRKKLVTKDCGIYMFFWRTYGINSLLKIYVQKTICMINNIINV